LKNRGRLAQQRPKKKAANYASIAAASATRYVTIAIVVGGVL
jgi:hypothetical protein